MCQEIAVIILNYFGFEATVKCIGSVQRTLKSIVFLIDNSADPAERNRLASHFRNHDGIYIFYPSDNLGFAGGVNRGLKEAIRRGFNRFFLLNNDAILLDGIKNTLEAAFGNWPGALIAPTIRWGKSPNKGYYYHRYFGLIVKEKRFKLIFKPGLPVKVVTF